MVVKMGYVKCIVSIPLSTNATIGDNKIDVCLTNGLVSNHEYSNGDGYVINSMERAYDLMRVVAVVWVAWPAGAAH